MKLPIRKHNALTIAGLSLIAGVFVFSYYLPGHRSNRTLRAEIAAAQSDVQLVPAKVAEVEGLQRHLASSAEYLGRMERLLPENSDLHSVVRQVSELARQADLQITRLEPSAPEALQSIQRIPVHLSFRGNFRGITDFLHGLETHPRLFNVDELSLTAATDKDGEDTLADMNFSVYVRDAEINDSASKSVQ